MEGDVVKFRSFGRLAEKWMSERRWIGGSLTILNCLTLTVSADAPEAYKEIGTRTGGIQ